MRYGKSKIGIDFAGAMHLLEGIERVLVVTVTDGVEVWKREIARHCAVPYTIDTEHDLGFPTFPEGCNVGPPGRWVEFRIVNWQGTYHREYIKGREWVPTARADLVEFAPELVIVDESHHAGNPTVEQSKQVYRLCRRARSVLLMTGTMFHRKPEYVFGQVKLYDVSVFGSDWGHYKRRVCIFGGFGGYELKRYKNLKWMMGRIKPWCIIEKKVPTMPPVVNVIPAPLTGRNLTVYNKMEKESIVKVGKAKSTADIILTKHLRCQQIAGGWLRTDEGYVRVGTCKLDIAASRLREYLAQDITKAVIGCRFIKEIGDLAREAKRIGFRPIVFHGGLPKGPRRFARVDRFNNATEPVLFIAQIRAARESIDLSSASTMMLYSLTESYVDYDQFTSRIEVFGDKRTLQYDHIIVPGTRDEVAWEAMQLKQDVATYIADDPARVERIVAAHSDAKQTKGKGSK